MSSEPTTVTQGPARRGRGPNLHGTERALLRTALAVGYGTGLSIRALCAEHDLSYGLAHTLLTEARVRFRRPGSRKAAER